MESKTESVCIYFSQDDQFASSFGKTLTHTCHSHSPTQLPTTEEIPAQRPIECGPQNCTPPRDVRQPPDSTERLTLSQQLHRFTKIRQSARMEGMDSCTYFVGTPAMSRKMAWTKLGATWSFGSQRNFSAGKLWLMISKMYQKWRYPTSLGSPFNLKLGNCQWQRHFSLGFCLQAVIQNKVYFRLQSGAPMCGRRCLLFRI